MQDDEVRKPYSVEIEVETFFSCTSEEDSGVENNMMSMTSLHMRPKSQIGSASGSNLGSNTNILSSRGGGGEKKSKKTDHLKLFEKKMTQKFKAIEQTKSSLVKSNKEAEKVKLA